MVLAETTYEHIVIGEGNVPLIEGTTTKVIELVEEKMAYGWSPEEFHFQHPYLTLGQIYSAFAYYYDHQEELEQDIERRAQFVEQLRLSAGPSALKAKLKAKGLL